MAQQDYETDVVIVGSGAGAMVAALKAHDEGARVLVIEKTELFGGTSAMSGGVMWFPASPMIEPAGGTDSMEAAREYMRYLQMVKQGDQATYAYQRLVEWGHINPSGQ